MFSNGWNGWRLGGGFDIGGFGVLVYEYIPRSAPVLVVCRAIT